MILPLNWDCKNTKYGCCPGTTLARKDNDIMRSNCPTEAFQNQMMIGGCAGTRYGCCPGSKIAANSDQSNCPSHRHFHIEFLLGLVLLLLITLFIFRKQLFMTTSTMLGGFYNDFPRMYEN